MAKKGSKGDSSGSGGRDIQPTGIEDLDEILQGGVPVGNTVLISGASGTGKTTVCFEILGRAAANGEAGLVLLTSETPDAAITNMAPYQFFDPSMVDDGNIVIQDMGEVYKHLGIDHPDTGLSQEDGHKLLDAIAKAVDEAKAKRVAIDSMTSVLATFDNEGRVRSFLKDLVRSMSDKGVTLYITSEIPPDSIRYSSSGIEDTLADGVILLSNIESRGDLLRSIQIIKMRGTEHSRSRYVMDLTEYGTIIVPVLKSYTKGGGE
jgi:circadian clock protein KaiC